jgi:hypothetical protein
MISVKYSEIILCHLKRRPVIGTLNVLLIYYNYSNGHYFIYEWYMQDRLTQPRFEPSTFYIKVNNVGWETLSLTLREEQGAEENV